jgi:hypothetical protein
MLSEKQKTHVRRVFIAIYLGKVWPAPYRRTNFKLEVRFARLIDLRSWPAPRKPYQLFFQEVHQPGEW